MNEADILFKGLKDFFETTFQWQFFYSLQKHLRPCNTVANDVWGAL